MSCSSCGSCGSRHGLNIWGLGIAFGLTWGLSTMFLGVMAWQFQHGTAIVAELSSIYWGYEGTFIGILFGTMWGFVDGFISGVLAAWFYNLYVKHCACDSKSCTKTPPKEKL